MIYEFKITLNNVGVPVWRKIQIDRNATFYDLHQILQASFEWLDYHLHSFDVRRTDEKSVEGIEISSDIHIDEFESFYVSEKLDEKQEKLADWFKRSKDKIIYIYDYGDDWQHEIVLQKISEREKDVIYPRCIDAKNIAPPEDSRGEVIRGEVELEYEDSHTLIADINEEIQIMELMDKDYDGGEIIDYWPKTLEKAKEFQQLKPWEIMTDEQIFAIEDPETGEYLFCSVLGAGGEMHGLAVYIGLDGFFSLVDSMGNIKSGEEIVKHQHSLLVSFEDRTDLEKEEYDLIKTYDVPFRGKKAWPSFISFQPGFYPWMLDEDEARQMYLALKETIKMYEELKDGLTLPHLINDEKMVVKVLVHDDLEDDFQNHTSNITDIVEAVSIEKYVGYSFPSELDIKRATKKSKPLGRTVEFSLTYLNIPIQRVEGERPIFPATVIVADHDEGMIYHHDIFDTEINIQIVQNEFLNIFSHLEGVPKEILTDHRTYSYMTPLLEHFNTHVEIVEELPIIDAVLEDMQTSIAQELDE